MPAPKKIPRGELMRLVLVAVWLTFLCGYCVTKNRDQDQDLSTPEVHSSNTDTVLSTVPEVFHVEIHKSLNASGTRVDWQIFRGQEMVVDNDRTVPPIRRKWETFQYDPTEERLSVFQMNKGHSVRERAEFVRDGIGLAIMAFIAFAYILVLLSRSPWTVRFVSALPYVIVTLIVFITLAQVRLTWLEGGLIASPMGQVLGTMMAILMTHAITAFDRKKLWRSLLNVLPVGVLGVGSILAQTYAMQRYDQGELLLFAHLYQDQYLGFLLVSLVLGLLSIFSRRLTGAQVIPLRLTQK